MSVTFVTPPTDCLAALKQGLQALATAQRLDLRGGVPALAVPATASALQPVPVYELGLDDLAAGRGSNAARLVAWRYLLITGNKARQAAEIIPDPASGGSRFGALTTGFVSGMEEAVRVADQLPEVQKGTYEMRALRIPAMYIMAVWLKDQKVKQDRFIVMPPAFPPIKPLIAYGPADFLTALQAMAAKKVSLEQKVTPP
jgi:hypothetical protein